MLCQANSGSVKLRVAAGLLAMLGLALWATPAVQAGSTNVTFTLNSAASQLVLSGSVTGDFFGTGFVSTIPLTGQGALVAGSSPPIFEGARSFISGTVNTRLDYDPGTLTALGINIKGSNIDPNPSGNWLPANWDGTTFTGGTEPADWGLQVGTLVKAAERNVLLDLRNQINAALPVSSGTFANSYGLEFKSGFNDLDAATLGTVDRQVLRDELDTYELAGPGVLQPNGQPYPGGIVWREVTGTDGFGNPTYDLTPAGLRDAFTSPVSDGIGADAVRIFNGSGQEIPQLFANTSPTASTLSVTPTGGGNVNLGLGLNVDATGSFFLGDFLVQLNFKGALSGTGTSLFVDPPPIAAASLGNQRVFGFDNAGTGAVFADAGDGLLAPFDAAYDASNNLYVADVLRSRITKFNANGVGAIFADAADGAVIPSGVAVAGDGSVFVTNYLTNSLVKVSPAGVGAPFADAGDGLSSPFGVATDAAGNVYVANLGTQQVLKIDPAGNATVFADTGDGLFSPFDVALDSSGNVYVADVLTSRVYKFTPAGLGSVFANSLDGLTTPSGLAFDSSGNLLVTNYLSNTIVRVNPAGVGSPFADAGDGINSPFGIAFNGATAAFGGASSGAGAGGGAAVPEPSTWALAAMGLVGLAMWRRRQVAGR